MPRLQGALRREVRTWCAARRPINVYEAAKALTFRMAARILLGLRLDQAQCAELSRTFEQFVGNLFSLPLDVPFSGLRKVLPPQPPAFLLQLSWRAPRVPYVEAACCGGGRWVALCPDLLYEPGRATHPLWARRSWSCSGRSSRWPPFGYSLAGASRVSPAPP